MSMWATLMTPLTPHLSASMHVTVHMYVCVYVMSVYKTTYVVVEVRMRTLDQFFEIEFLTYSNTTSLCLSMYHVVELKKTLLQQSYRA